eukprot:3932036-Rhodomonas_salina.2
MPVRAEGHGRGDRTETRGKRQDRQRHETGQTRGQTDKYKTKTRQTETRDKKDRDKADKTKRNRDKAAREMTDTSARLREEEAHRTWQQEQERMSVDDDAARLLCGGVERGER